MVQKTWMGPAKWLQLEAMPKSKESPRPLTLALHAVALPGFHSFGAFPLNHLQHVILFPAAFCSNARSWNPESRHLVYPCPPVPP